MDELFESGSIVIDRPTAEVYALVSDVTQMGRWSPVCKACWWDEGAGPRPGAGFTGRNETPERTWQTHSLVDVADEGREFAFLVGARLDENGSATGGVARWGYEFAANEDGTTTVTESWRFLPGGYTYFTDKYGDHALAQIENRRATAVTGIAATLAAIKAAAEEG